MRRVSPISRLVMEDPNMADADLDALYDYMEKLEDSLQASYETLKEIDTYWSLPHVGDAGTWGGDETEREKYLRKVIHEMRNRANQTLRLMDQIISPEVTGGQL